MNAYSTLIRVLNSGNVAYTDTDTGTGRMVDIGAGKGPANEGESGLYTRFIFNEEGDLESVGTWQKAKRGLKLVA